MTEKEYIEFAKLQFEANHLQELSNENLLLMLKKLSDIFLETNAHMNLTAIKDERLVVTRHFCDCLLVQDQIPNGSKIIDIGSGGGMPSLPLAIARPDLDITALDATNKKVEYINNTAKDLNLTNIHAICGRAEELSHTNLRESFDIAVARAVAELRILSELCASFVRPRGLFIAMKGKNGKNELQSALNSLKLLNLSLTKEEYGTLKDYDGTVSDRSTFVFRKEKKNPSSYPRTYAQILKKPL